MKLACCCLAAGMIAGFFLVVMFVLSPGTCHNGLLFFLNSATHLYLQYGIGNSSQQFEKHGE